MRDTRVIIVEGILVLILTALVQPELVRLGSTATGNEAIGARPQAAVAASAASAGRDMKIRFVVSRRTHVNLGIFEPSGHQVRRLSDTETAAGPHTGSESVRRAGPDMDERAPEQDG